MKRILVLSFCILAFSCNLFAQAPEKFDIATFQPPSGWKKQDKPGALIYTTSNEQSGVYAMIIVYGSGVSTGSAKKDFDDDWREYIGAQLGIKGDAEVQPIEKKDGWEIVSGGTAFENQSGAAAVMLSTYSGFGKTFTVAALFNSRDHLTAIDALASSIKLEKPTSAPQPRAAPAQVAGQPSLTQFFWKQSQTRKDAGGYAGYSKNTYQFMANGTYRFSREDFQNYAPKFYLENEEGTYTIAGNTLTLDPRKASFSSHRSNREDAPTKTGSLPMAAMQYRFELMNLNDNWTLLLSPADGRETKRDGGFTFWLNGAKQNTYTYNWVNAAGELIR